MRSRLLCVMALGPAVLAANFVIGGNASAQVVGGQRYGIVTVHNKTGGTISYSYRVGAGGWHKERIEPGHYRYFYHVYDFANENRSPSLQIRFDSDARGGFVASKEYALKRRPAPWVNPDFGRHYDFKYRAGDQIDLFAR
jgi:hypothetical protein